MAARSKSLLVEYKSKRHFDNTPEPAGKVEKKRSGDLRFVVQKHRASHLHYDFRLEADGVLKSWAVPKGPSLRPAERRLAMQVEDHPLDYYDFEGIIPEGNYGAGEVIVWDAGKYRLAEGADPAQEIDRGKIKIVLHGRKLHGKFTLVRMHGRGASDRGWLLIKEKDESADPAWDPEEHEQSVKSGRTLSEVAKNPRAKKWISNRTSSSAAAPKRTAKLPKISGPALCTLIDAPFDDDDWMFEIKWDGVRAITTIDTDRSVRMVSRKGLDQVRKYPELADVGAAFSGLPAIVDGEIVSLDSAGKSSFQRLQSADNRKGAAVTYVVFDLLYWNGRDLRKEPLETRKELLERALTGGGGRVLYSKHVVGRGKELFALAARQGLEGIIGKRLGTPYTEGRTRDWVKIKTHLQQECVIAGWTDPKGSRSGFGALLLGLYDKGKLRYVGQVGTGFSQKTIADVMKQLKALSTKESPFAERPKVHSGTHWVKPERVGEIRFSEWTKDGMMRHPAFLGLRDDKRPKDCVREVPR